jgi:hypothetical protein
MTSKRSLVSALGLIALTAMIATGAISASAGKQSTGNQLVGSWAVTVDRSPLPPLQSLQTYTGGRSLVETASTVGIRGPGHGTWQHTGGLTYAVTHWFFRFDPMGAYIGTQQINSNLRLAPDGESFTGVAISTLRDPAGNVVLVGLRATVAGKRIDVERIPDQP